MAEPRAEPSSPRGQPRASLALDDGKHPSRLNSHAKGKRHSAWKKDIPQEKRRKSRRQEKGICAFSPAWLPPRDEVVLVTRHIPWSSLSHQQPQSKIASFPPIPLAQSSSACSTSRARNLSAPTSTPYGHRT